MKTKSRTLFFSALLGFMLAGGFVKQASAGGGLVAPPILGLYCYSDAQYEIQNWLTDYYVDAGCDAFNVTNNYAGGVPGFCTEQFITVTWTALTDNCGTLTATSVIHVHADLTPPQLDAPSSLILSCIDDLGQISNWLYDYYVFDDCPGNTGVTNNYSPGSLPTFCQGGNVTVTWTATDGCGNTSTATAGIQIVADNTEPALNVPSDLFLDCDDANFQINGWLWDYIVWDDCSGNPTVTNNYPGSLPSFCQGGNVTVTWTATDGCGNSSQQSATINVAADNDPPLIDHPLDLTIDCDDNINLFNGWLYGVDAYDECTTIPLVTHNYTGTSPDFCSGGSTTVTWTATDGCGNTSTARADLIPTQDTQPPQLTCAATEFNPCYSESDFDTPAVSDCQSTTLTVFSTLANPMSNGGVIYCRTWRATDFCGNSSTCAQCIVVTSPLTVDAGPNKLVYIGYPDSACARLQSTISGGAPPYSRMWSTAGNPNLGSGNFINVCPTTTRVYYLTVTDGNGCVARDSVKVCVFDVRCGNNMNNVLICHGTGSATNPFITLCVDKPGAKWHFKNHAGEKLGACGMNKSCTFPIETRIDAFNYDVIEEQTEFLGAFPNPFNGSTTVRFMIPEDDFATVKVVDVIGRDIQTLYNGATEAGGIYAVTFEGASYSKGMYFLVMQSQKGIMKSQKLILEK